MSDPHIYSLLRTPDNIIALIMKLSKVNQNSGPQSVNA